MPSGPDIGIVKPKPEIFQSPCAERCLSSFVIKRGNAGRTNGTVNNDALGCNIGVNQFSRIMQEAESLVKLQDAFLYLNMCSSNHCVLCRK